jgi:hypothetical protein
MYVCVYNAQHINQDEILLFLWHINRDEVPFYLFILFYFIFILFYFIFLADGWGVMGPHADGNRRLCSLTKTLYLK